MGCRVPQHPVGPPALCTRAVLSGHPAGLQGATASGWATCSVYACRPLWPPCRAAGCQRPSWHAGSASGARCQWGKVQAVPVGQGASFWLPLSFPSTRKHVGSPNTKRPAAPHDSFPSHMPQLPAPLQPQSCIPTTHNTQNTTHNMSCIPTTCNTHTTHDTQHVLHPHNMQHTHTTHDTQHVLHPHNMQHTTHNSRLTTHNMSCIPTTHNTQHKTHNTQHVLHPYNTQHTTHDTQHVLHPHNMQHTTHNTQHTTCPASPQHACPPLLVHACHRAQVLPAQRCCLFGPAGC